MPLQSAHSGTRSKVLFGHLLRLDVITTPTTPPHRGVSHRQIKVQVHGITTRPTETPWCLSTFGSYALYLELRLQV